MGLKPYLTQLRTTTLCYMAHLAMKQGQSYILSFTEWIISPTTLHWLHIKFTRATELIRNSWPLYKWDAWKQLVMWVLTYIRSTPSVLWSIQTAPFICLSLIHPQRLFLKLRATYRMRCMKESSWSPCQFQCLRITPSVLWSIPTVPFLCLSLIHPQKPRLFL